MMWGYYDGGGWLWMMALVALFWGAIIALVVFAVRSFAPGRHGDAALDSLRKRFAAGDISQDEYEKARKVLQG
jgi:putative membrane protein